MKYADIAYVVCTDTAHLRISLDSYFNVLWCDANFIFVESITLNKLMIKICYFEDRVKITLIIWDGVGGYFSTPMSNGAVLHSDGAKPNYRWMELSWPLFCWSARFSLSIRTQEENTKACEGIANLCVDNANTSWLKLSLTKVTTSLH